MAKKDFSEAVCYLRVKNKLTQSMLARKAGINRSMVNRIENLDNYPMPSVLTVAKLSQALGVSYETMMTILLKKEDKEEDKEG